MILRVFSVDAFNKKTRTHEKIRRMAAVTSKLLLNVSNLYYCIFQIISMTIMTDEELRQRKSSTIKSESAQAASSADVKTSATSATSSASAASSSSSSVATAMSSNVKLEHSDSNLTSSLLVNLLQNKDNFAAAAAAQAALSLSAGAAGSAQAAALSQAVKSEAVMAAAAAHAAATAAAASSGLNPAAGSMGGLGSGSTPPKKLRLNSSVSASVGAGSGLNPGASILCKSEQMASASFSDSTNKLLHHSNSNLHEKDSSTTNKINRSQSKSASNTLSMTAGVTPRGAMGAGSSSLMPPPLQPPVIAGANPALAGASGTISTLKIHEINTATGEKQFVKTSRKDAGNFRLNPITGELESGPSESSSEGEADTPTSGLETGSMNSISSNSTSKNSSTGSSGSNMNSNSGRGPDSSKALKLKLKLPVTPPTSSSEVSGGHSRLSSMTSSSSDFSKNDPKVSKSDLNNGPKLPKLILSMRDKTVKVSANSLNKNKRALEEADMDAADDSDGQDSISESQNITVPSLQGKLKIKSPKRTLDSDVKTEFNIKSEFNTKLVPSSSSSNSSSRHGTLNNHVNSATNQSKSSSRNSSNNSSGSTNNSSSSDSKDSSSKPGGVQVNNSTASSSLNNSSSSDSSKKSSNNSSGILKKADLAGNSNAGSGNSTPSSSTKKLHNNDRLSAWAKTLSSRLEKGAFANSLEHDHDTEDFASNIKKGKFSDNFKETYYVKN